MYQVSLELSLQLLVMVHHLQQYFEIDVDCCVFWVQQSFVDYHRQSSLHYDHPLRE
jgi:hypothetical protein